MKHRPLSAAILSFAAIAAAALAGAAPASFPDEAEPRARWSKPQRAVVTPTDEQHIVYVKFLDDLPVRAIDGLLTDRATGALNPARDALNALPIARWQPVNDLPDDRLAAIRATAERALRKALPDLATEFFAFLDGGADPAAVIDALNALDIVELADAQPKPVEPPLPPDFQSNQGYLTASPAGVDALHGWATLGTRGEGVAIVDLEYTFNPDHADLPTVQIIGGPQVDPGFGPNHGTAVLGQVGALNNGWGVTGIAHGSTIAFASTYAGSVWNVGGAIINATAALSPGDVILVEQQMSGPNGSTAYVPIEWRLQWYNAVVNAVANGMIVVIAAGNGSQNLDAPIFSTGNGGHWPFLPQNDSGSIIVGAGAAAAGFNNSTTPRSRLSFSNYGSRVNLQGWGERVWTTGYGGAFSSMGPNYHYTATFQRHVGPRRSLPARRTAHPVSVQGDEPGQTLTWSGDARFSLRPALPQQSGNEPAQPEHRAAARPRRRPPRRSFRRTHARATSTATGSSTSPISTPCSTISANRASACPPTSTTTAW